MSEEAHSQGYVGPKAARMIDSFSPPQQRHQTDVCCLLIGLFLTVGMVGSVFYFRNAQYMMRISYPSDSNGNVCGYDYPNEPYLSFPTAPSISHRVCVSACPASTQLHQNPTGKLCLPANKALRKKLLFKDKCSNKYMFFLQFDRFYLILGAAVVMGLLLLFMMLLCPGPMMHTILFLSLIMEILLGVVFYLYGRQNLGGKIVTTTILGVTFLLSLFHIILYRQSLTVNKLFLYEGKKFIAERKRVVLYIPFFMMIAAGFVYLLYMLYVGGLSVLPPTLSPNNIYYNPDKIDFLTAVPLLSLYFIWGIFCIKQTFFFFLSTHVIHHIYQKEGSAFCLAIRLTFKHLGSIFGSALINSFLLIPAAIYDAFRNCRDAKFSRTNCCSSIFDMVRPDALSFVVLMGTPYCNSAKYCDYFWYESMTTEKTQSTLRVYKLAAHAFVTISASIAGLFYLGIIQGSILYFDLIGGMVLATFLIDLPVDVTDTLRLLYLMEEESYKRREDCFKFTDNVLSKTDQLHFIRTATQIFQNRQLALNLVRVRQEHWKIEDEKPEKKKDKKKRKSKLVTEPPLKQETLAT